MVTSKSQSAELEALRDDALKAIAKLQESLPLDDAMHPHDREIAQRRMRVPTAAMKVAASILDELEGRAGDYDVESVRSAVASDAVLGEIAAKLSDLASRLESTVMKQRSAAAAVTSGLLQSLRGLAKTDPTVTPFVERLAPELAQRSRRKSQARASASAPTSSSPEVPVASAGNSSVLTAPTVTITPSGVTVAAPKPTV
jgi:hypothetical protein